MGRGLSYSTLSGLIIAASVTGCAPDPKGEPSTGIARQPIMGGYVDGETKGAVGLAANFLDVFFFGHCSGSLLAPNLVLTAQHCVAMVDGESPSGGIVCGVTDYGMTAGGQVFRVTVETERPEQDGAWFYKGADMPVRTPPGPEEFCGYDLALIILEGGGIPSEVATPLIPRIDSTPVAGEQYSAIGYGLTDPDDSESSGTRMRIDENTITCVGDGCDGSVSIMASEWRGDAPTCSGDSGGPALDSEGRVMGVLSRGPAGCLSSVYGDVGSWDDFIVETALEAAELGGYAPPFWAITGSSTPPQAAGPGEICLGICSEGYVCSPDGEERRCLPACDDQGGCEGGRLCNEVGACEEAPVSASEDGGCRASPGPERDSRGWTWTVTLLLAGGIARASRRYERKLCRVRPRC